MCGIAGFVNLRQPLSNDVLTTRAIRMADTLAHRGPDDAGVYADAAAQVALSFRRLSIIDLSAEGRQPMRSAGGRYHLVFNGEIYNFVELRRELEKLGCTFRGHADSEVLLAAIEQWGVAHALNRANGMFAIALWDSERRELSLARDRAGKKPVYYGWAGGCFAFASELKALRALPGFDAQIDRGALALFLRHNYIPAPYSIYDGVYKLRQAELLTLPSAAIATRHTPDELARFRQTFWSFADVVRDGTANPFNGGDREACDALERLLSKSVALRMVSDVPLGALLSGGIDSSTVTALMQAASSRPIKTFSIGFHERDYNEAEYAGAVAAHLGTDHTELYVSPTEAMAVIPKLPAIYDEPFADVSQVPTFLVSRLARRDVTVALSGDGGDELFAGYTRYLFAQRVAHAASLPGRRLIAGMLERRPAARWDEIFGRLPSVLHPAQVGDKLHKLAPLLREPDAVGIYRRLFSHWSEPETIVRAAEEPLTPLTDTTGQPPVAGFIERMMQLDFLTWLPDDVLAKVDRASMAVSLEVRCPLLDPDVIAFAWHLPRRLRVRNGRGKWLLRQVLGRYVPSELFERPKMGFDVPIGRWLREPLRDWAEALLDPARLVREGYFNPAPIRERWREHLTGERNWQYQLWDVLMFQAWLEAAQGRAVPVPASHAAAANEVAQ
ncbi:MAG TPA: asparagine synthase (glutamine-hydrolyzing) [Gammaproteobacteria bacterium]|nr:asparagine synthase (glutamine-hydrolyzing) [Gammaproteobacteria bacterium]